MGWLRVWEKMVFPSVPEFLRLHSVGSPGLKPAFTLNNFRGPEGPLFHDSADIHVEPRGREAVKKSTQGLHNIIAKSKNVRTLQE